MTDCLAEPKAMRTPAHVALARVCAELTRLTERLLRVEEAIGRVLDDAGAASAELVVDLQEIDIARQEAAALAHVIARLAECLPASSNVDLERATRAVALGDLAARLVHGARFSVARSDAVLFE